MDKFSSDKLGALNYKGTSNLEKYFLGLILFSP